MSELSSIRTMRDLEHQRAILLQKAAREEQKVRQDIEVLKDDYMPVVNVVSGIRSGFSRVRTILGFALPILNFLRSRRRRS